MNIGFSVKKGDIVRIGKRLLEVTADNRMEAGVWSSIWCSDHRAYFSHKGKIELVKSTGLATYIIKNDDIDYISKRLAEITKGDETIIARELVANLIVANVRNGG
jgi:hypothetical protein